MMQDTNTTTTDDAPAACATARPDITHVASLPDLGQAAPGWRRSTAIGLDTEFLRTRHYFPQLGLVQLADRDGVYLVDPLSMDDLSPLVETLGDASVEKVLHSCAEDLEVLTYLCGFPPAPVFDTQVAAAFLGHGFQAGYQQLVREMLGVELPKDATRSNWMKRPLSEAQILYAALDVHYLLPLADLLKERLSALGRLSWVVEECARITAQSGDDAEPEAYYLRFPGAWKCGRRELGLLRALFAWRERVALCRDLPRSFVISDKALKAVARIKPRTLGELSRIEELTPPEVRRHGRKLVTAVNEVLALPEEEMPPRLPKPPNPRLAASAVDKLRGIVQERAAVLGMPPELLARRKAVSDLVRNQLLGQADPVPEELAGWRYEQITRELLAAL